MTITEIERVLQSCNPRLHIVRTASGKGAIHLDGLFVCRLDQGEVTLYNQWKWAEGESNQMATQLNPRGWHKYQLMVKRGRCELARILYTKRIVNLADVAKITWGLK